MARCKQGGRVALRRRGRRRRRLGCRHRRRRRHVGRGLVRRRVGARHLARFGDNALAFTVALARLLPHTATTTAAERATARGALAFAQERWERRAGEREAAGRLLQLKESLLQHLERRRRPRVVQARVDSSASCTSACSSAFAFAAAAAAEAEVEVYVTIGFLRSDLPKEAAGRFPGEDKS
eukprot:scaffold21577_cov67-Phaeocystis_antarctica.AAC.2